MQLVKGTQFWKITFLWILFVAATCGLVFVTAIVFLIRIIDKYDYLTGEEILPFNQRQKIEPS